MCRRCGCITHAQDTASVNPAVVEGMVEATVLLLLVRQDSYGYELSATLKQSRMIPHKIQSARVYEVLQRLETDGAVASGKLASPVGPDRRCYSLTSSGRIRLERWVQALRLTENSLSTFLHTYNTSTIRRKEVKVVGCNCTCCGGNQRESQTGNQAHTEHEPQSEDQMRAEREKQARQARISQLEAELQALKSQA